MSKRDALFIGLCLFGLVFLGRTLLSSQRQSPAERRALQLAEAQSPERWAGLDEVVRRADDDFRTRWNQLGLEPAGRASEMTRIRRLSLALMGSVPSLEEIRLLEALEPDQRLRWWVDYLLRDPRSGRHIAERLTRAYVGTENGPFLLYRRSRFRDWLAEEVLKNRPYDELVRELIAGNGLWTTAPSVNFLTVTLDANNDNQPDPVRLAGRTSRAFLGMRIDCLQCHDDKLQNVELGDGAERRFGTQRDFHQLAAFFCEANVSALGVRDAEGDYEVEYLDPKEPKPTDAIPPFLPEIRPTDGPLRQQLAEWVTSDDNRPFARATVNRMWALVFNRPLVNPIDDIPLYPPEEGYPPAMEILAEDFAANGFDLHRLIRIIVSLEPFQLDSRHHELLSDVYQDNWAIFPMTRLRPEQVAASVLQSCSIESLDDKRHFFIQLRSFGGKNDFIQRYGDTGEDEFIESAGTLPQRLVMMNGELVKELTGENEILSAASRISSLAANDEQAVEIAFLCVLSRRPSSRQLEHFAKKLSGTTGRTRADVMEDLFWALMNCTEFNWNH